MSLIFILCSINKRETRTCPHVAGRSPVHFCKGCFTHIVYRWRPVASLNVSQRLYRDRLSPSRQILVVHVCRAGLYRQPWVARRRHFLQKMQFALFRYDNAA